MPDGFEPSERGSSWFVADSLDLRGAGRPAFGLVGDYTYRSLAIRTPEGVTQATPVASALYGHLGASVVLADRVRLAASIPLQLFVDGEAQASDVLPPPPTEQGVGDLRLGSDVRLFGTYGDAVTIAAGVQAWLPTGATAQYAGDGELRVRPRAMMAGELGSFVYAAELGVRYRGRSETVGGIVIGSDVGATLAAGARLFDRKVHVGAELYGSTVLSDPLGRRATPLEALLSVHHAVSREVRVGAGVGTGLLRDFGPPAIRGLLTLEWTPSAEAGAEERQVRDIEGGVRAGEDPRAGDGDAHRIDACREGTVAGGGACAPDADGDGIDDIADACPTVPGIRTSTPHDNGCPNRDPDADGIVSELDACPDEAGLKDPDPKRSGCPLVFARGEALELRIPLSFAAGSAEVPNDAKNLAVLEALARYMLAKPQVRIRIEGHTDDRAPLASGSKLSAARADAVARWLIAQGVDATRLESRGLGSERPLRSNETEAGRRANERIELHFAH